MLDFLKAGLKRNHPLVFDSALLPRLDQNIRQKINRVDGAKIKAYHNVVQWYETQHEDIHPCFLHLYAFKQHMQLMLNEQFPFALLGIVHLSNQIEVLMPLDRSSELELESKLVSFKRHVKGISFKIESTFYQHQQVIWQSVSELLAVNKSCFVGKSQSTPYQLDTNLDFMSQWHCDIGIGRRYGKVSGDFNPIHLSQISAKLFGFKSAIAHGMWSKARIVSEFQQQISDTFFVKVNFLKPLFLPSDVILSKASNTASKSQFVLTSEDKQICHCEGQIMF
ncbi:MaoC family dehydratase [Aliiglaciecola sp. SL4]|uniref:MaoC family dehydratase n=1 Tax=Aliiglaciecola sp. SL4 TaxID=3239806 RepID=UPI00355C08DE